MKVAGIDPSLTGTGVVVLDASGNILIEELLKTSKQEGTVKEVYRLVGITNEVMELVAGCDLVVIEGLAFMARNTTALIQLSALNYFIRKELIWNDIPFIVAAPSSLKKFVTGKGNAKKDSMYLETYKRYGISFTDDNLCDSFGLSRIGLDMLRETKGLELAQKEVIQVLSTQL